MIAIGLGALLFFAAPARLVVEWLPRVVPLGNTGAVEVELGAGQIQVAAGQPGRVLVRGVLRTTASDAETAKAASRRSTLSAQSAGEGAIIRPQISPVAHATTDVELHLEIPPQAELKIRLRDGNIVATGLRGPLDLKTRAGSIRVEISGPVTLHAQATRGRIDQTLGLEPVSLGRGATLDGPVSGGGPRVSLETGTGNVVVRSASP